MKDFRLLTITHKTANINHIGQYIPSVNADPVALSASLHAIKERFQMEEMLYLATCNRLTLFFVRAEETTDTFIIDLFRQLHPGIPEMCLGGVLDVVAKYDGEHCIQHLFEIASSLDSLVVGEREIIRQLRDAYEFCQRERLTGDSIRLVMKMAIPVGKEVYTNTRIGENSVSIVSLAVNQLMKRKLPLSSRFLVVGAGQTNALAIKILQQKGYEHFTIFNRTEKNALYLAEQINGQGHTLDVLDTYQAPFDAVLCCTGAAMPLLTKKMYTRLLGGDQSEKVIVDLGVPNDVAASVVRDFAVDYIEVESLRQVAQQNMALRMKEVTKAKAIIDEKLTEFLLQYRQRRVERGLSVIPTQVRAVREKALDNVFKKEIDAMDVNAKALLEKVVAYMEKKYVGIPMAVAKQVIEEELKR